MNANLKLSIPDFSFQPGDRVAYRSETGYVIGTIVQLDGRGAWVHEGLSRCWIEQRDLMPLKHYLRDIAPLPKASPSQEAEQYQQLPLF